MCPSAESKVQPLSLTDLLILSSSSIRQVPDHQEVYLATDGFASLVFDLGERVMTTNTDEAAILYHFEDIVDEKDDRKVWSIRKEGIEMPHLP